jgi:hypothetical protein
MTKTDKRWKDGNGNDERKRRSKTGEHGKAGKRKWVSAGQWVETSENGNGDGNDNDSDRFTYDVKPKNGNDQNGND